jgi:hypothetical protein
MIFVQNDKLHLHTGIPDIRARLESSLPPYRNIQRISMKLELLSLNGPDSWINLVLLDERGHRQDWISMYTIGGEQASFNFVVSSASNRTWTAPFPMEKGREYLLETVVTPDKGLQFTVTGSDMIKYSSEYSRRREMANFRFEVDAVTAPGRVPARNPHRHFYVHIRCCPNYVCLTQLDILRDLRNANCPPPPL